MKLKLISLLLLLIGVVAYSQEKENNLKENLEETKRLCEEGDNSACENLYHRYHYIIKEKNNKEDEDKLLYYVKRLSDLKRPKYMFVWGMALMEGILENIKIQEDFKMGVELIKQSADLDYPPAQMVVGDFLCITDNAADLFRGLYYIKRACDSHYPPACYIITKIAHFSNKPITEDLRECIWEALETCNDPYIQSNKLFQNFKDKYRKQPFIKKK